MMTGREDDRELREALAAALEAVGRDTGAAIHALKNKAKANRRLIHWVGALTVGLVVVAFIGMVNLIGAIKASNAVEKIQQRTSDKVLCPLYGAFLAAKDNPVPDNIKNDPRQMREREEAFRVIEQGARELGCFEKWEASKR